MTGNITAAWIAFLCGALAGAVPGLLFHDSDWLGGYDSWRRRLIRLGHISFFGIGLLNLGFALTVRSLEMDPGALETASWLFILGLVTMPLVCYLSAWKMTFRHLFFVPAGSVMLAIVLFLWRLVQP